MNVKKKMFTNFLKSALYSVKINDEEKRKRHTDSLVYKPAE